MRRMGVAAAIGFSVLLLVSTLGLGFMAAWERVDPNLHSMVAFPAGVLAVGMHIRGGSGLDFLAVLLLLAALGLGLMVLGGGMSSQLHLWAAVPAVAVSVYTQSRGLFSEIRNARGGE